MRIEPSTPEGRIVVTPAKRGRHQEFWPTVEVTERVTVVAHETWGTRAATYEIVAEHVIDIRNGGPTREAIDEAKRQAHYRINAMRRDVEAANPDYMKPARY
jgi:hypothetical protein